MKTSELTYSDCTALFEPLVTSGELSAEQLKSAWEEADQRKIHLERVLRFERNITRRRLLEVLAAYYQCDWAEYDERRPVPMELLKGLESGSLLAHLWFPVIRDGDTVIIAANNPRNPAMRADARRLMTAPNLEFRVALTEDIVAYIQDFTNGPPEHLMGNERTGLAYWRNTMARWRTRLACYRTDFAMARTHLSLLRGGLGMITIGRAMVFIHPHSRIMLLYWLMIGIGFALVILGLYSYARIKRAIMRPPKLQTLVVVTSASLYFFENYQFAQNKPEDPKSKKTMLSRLADMIPSCCVYIDSSLDNKVRSYLAHERNSLAAQRTVLGCYRTIYARARTGLSFIRTGVSFASIGIGLMGYFGFDALTLLDCFLILAGILMTVDGVMWSWPVRKEKHEAGGCAVVS